MAVDFGNFINQVIYFLFFINNIPTHVNKISNSVCILFFTGHCENRFGANCEIWTKCRVRTPWFQRKHSKSKTLNILFSKRYLRKVIKHYNCKKGLQFKPLEVLLLQDIRHLTQEPVWHRSLLFSRCCLTELI